ncbi:MAG: M14 family metallopeptidase [Bacteroidota bacterium]
MKCSLFFFMALVFSPILAFAQPKEQWLTFYERSNYRKTPDYSETVTYCKRLAQASPWIHYTSFGKTPQGRDLPLVIISKEKAFTPSRAMKTGKAIVLIQSGIHAGEIDGKDASLMLIRDMAVTREKAPLLDHVIVLVVPIFNVDGHERISPYNRINQNGPDEMGWRVTAQNLNLNRDYMKADAPEMRAMLKLFSRWLPDFYIDCHVTDGLDFQYDVTYSMALSISIDESLADWNKKIFLPWMTAEVEKKGHIIAPYIFPREDKDLSKGLIAGPTPPRFSTEYGAIQNRPTLLIETHMLKPYKTRVTATYDILVATLELMNRENSNLRALNLCADATTQHLGRSGNGYVPLQFEATKEYTPLEFKGLRSQMEFSDISASERTIYTEEPMTMVVPYFDKIRVTDSVLVPKYYCIPQEWDEVIEVLAAHDIQMRKLTSPITIDVQMYKLTEPKWQERPTEGRHMVRCASELFTEKRTFPAGTIVVPTDQRTARVIVNLLEPRGPDSFVSWGFFNTIFEQKEYAEDYVLEKLAREMIKDNPGLEKEFYLRLASDTAFAKNPRARLNFFYQHSLYWDKSLGVYPIARVMTDIDEKVIKNKFVPEE